MQNKIIDIVSPDASEIEDILFPVVTGTAHAMLPDGSLVESPDEKLVMGEGPDGFFPIKTVGRKFNAFPYGDVFAAMKEAIQGAAPDAKIARAGLLDHGGRFFATWRLPVDISPLGGDDETFPEITLRSALNGKWKNSISFGAFRMICANGIVQYSLKEMLLGFKRTLNADLRIPEIGDAIAKALAGGETYKRDMSRLVEIPLAGPDMQALVAGFFANGKGELSTRARNITSEIADGARNSPGTKGETAYDLLNGFTHHFSHSNGESEKSAAKWFDSQNFGSASRHKAEFAKALLGNRDELLAKGRKALVAA